ERASGSGSARRRGALRGRLLPAACARDPGRPRRGERAALLVAGAAQHRERRVAPEARVLLGAPAAPEAAAAAALLHGGVDAARAEADGRVHPGSLHSAGVQRLSALAARLARLLALAERALEERVGAPPAPELFDRHLAFRWEARGAAGRPVPIRGAAPLAPHRLPGGARP